MFKNINNLLILIAGLIICYIFYNVFILENFVNPDQYTGIPNLKIIHDTQLTDLNTKYDNLRNELNKKHDDEKMELNNNNKIINKMNAMKRNLGKRNLVQRQQMEQQSQVPVVDPAPASAQALATPAQAPAPTPARKSSFGTPFRWLKPNFGQK